MAVGAKIRARRRELGMTQQKLADSVGVVRNFISAIEAGKTNPSSERLPSFAKALKVPLSYLDVSPDIAPKSEVLLQGEKILGQGKHIIRTVDQIRDFLFEVRDANIEMAKVREEVFAENKRFSKSPVAGEKRPELKLAPVSGGIARQVPFYGSVAAGTRDGLKNGIAAPEGWISVGDDVLSAWPDAFAFRVEGDSMEPEAHENDLVICSRETPPRNGDIVVADIHDAWLLKRLVGNGIEAMLYPVNTKHKPISIRENTDIRIVKVLALVRKYD